MLSIPCRYINNNAMNIELGRYPLGPDLSFLSGSTMLSTNAKSVFAKISSEENESSLTGLGCCLLCLLSLSPFCLYLYLSSQEPLSTWISALSQQLLWIYYHQNQFFGTVHSFTEVIRLTKR